MEIVGVGESMDEAYSGARAWFENAFDKFGDQRWNELVAMQNNLNAVPETVLHEKTGVTLDEWLVRLASLGQSPGTPQPPKPPKPTGSPMVTKVNSGWELHVWILAGIFIAAGPVVNLIRLIQLDLRHDTISYSISDLLASLVTSLTLSVIFAAFWFRIFKFFKEDATLQDYLFFLLIVELASFFVSAAMGIGQSPGYPNF